MLKSGSWHPDEVRSIHPEFLIVKYLFILSLFLTVTAYGDGLKPSVQASSASRVTLLISLPDGPSWQDMAFLAAVPSATHVNRGMPSLLALDAAGAVTPEIKDYLRRYKPTAIHQLGGASVVAGMADRSCELLKAGSAEEAACQLSAKFWKGAPMAVICADDDYAMALVAAPLAASVQSPLFFVSKQGVSPQTLSELKRLKVQKLLTVGNISEAKNSLKQAFPQISELANVADVMKWVKWKGLTATYLTALNPLDRDQTVIKKLSLSGALLAAGRGGFVLPLPYRVEWKVPYVSSKLTGELPVGLAPNTENPNLGNIVMGEQTSPFICSGDPKLRNQRVQIDLDKDGKYAGSGEGPFATGDAVEFSGKRYTLSFGNGKGTPNVMLTWPRPEQLVTDLRQYYDILGAAPEHLCLIGFPDAIPQAIMGRGGVVEELTSDAAYANADEDPFVEIGVARVVADSASSSTLYVSRVLTYPLLLSDEWQDRACQARWENTAAKLFENYGYDAAYQHTKEDLKQVATSKNEKKGNTEKSFSQDSPLAHCAVLTHADHSWWRELGHTFDWDANVIIAPVVVESGGCLTGALDKEPDYHSVVARLFRQGAVAFAGNNREGIAAQELQRMEFWNGVLSGQSMGQSHRKSMNSAMVTILDKKEGESGAYRYQFNIRTQFGDPAFVMRVPSKAHFEPAHVTVSENKLTVHAPAQWFPTKIFVPEDWKLWTDKSLHVLRGPGTYARRGWCAEQYDKEEIYFTAEFTTRKKVAKINQTADALPKPLGWSGNYYVDEHADGSRTYRWAIRMADFDQTTGKMISTVDHIDYQIEYQ